MRRLRDTDVAAVTTPLDLLDDQPVYRMLCRFEKHDRDAGSAVFVDALPPFGVVEIADSTWQQMGEPRELRVTLEVVHVGL